MVYSKVFQGPWSLQTCVVNIALRRFLHNDGNIATDWSLKSELCPTLIEWLQGLFIYCTVPQTTLHTPGLLTVRSTIYAQLRWQTSDPVGIRTQYLWVPSHIPYRVISHRSWQDKTRQDKTRQDKTRQDKTRQDKTRQDKTRQDKTRQDKTRQDKTRQDKTRQDKTRQDKTRQDKTRQDKTRQDKTRQDKTRQDKTRQDKTRQDKTRQNADRLYTSPRWKS